MLYRSTKCGLNFLLTRSADRKANWLPCRRKESEREASDVDAERRGISNEKTECFFGRTALLVQPPFSVGR